MASWDSADLVQRVKDEFGRPETDALFTDPRIYRALTAAEAFWKPELAVHAPEDLWTAPAIMAAASDEKTFAFPGGEVDPLAFMILRSQTGYVLKPGAYWDRESDYVVERGQIRITAGASMTFPDGAPYVRVIAAPADIDDSTESTIFPTRLRQLVVLKACAQLARSGMGIGDPSFYEEAMDELAWGNPGTGSVGMIGAMKKRDQMAGLNSIAADGSFAWWRPNG